MVTYYRWKNKFKWDERISDEISYIAQKTTEETLQYNIENKKTELKLATKNNKIREKILNLLEQFLTKVEEGNTQYLPFARACTLMSSKLNNDNTQSTTIINTITEQITTLNKALHPEDVRGGLPSLAESIEQAIQKLGDTNDDNQ